MKHIPVEGHKNLARDTKTGAIVNINKQSIEDARAAKARRLQDKNRIERLESDVAEIKSLLLQLVKQNG